VTAQVIAWPGAAASPPRARMRPVDTAAFALSVLMILVYAQPWTAFLPEQAVSDAGSSLARIMFFPMYALGVGLAVLRPVPALRGLLGQPFLILLLGVAAASIGWSVSPDETPRRVIAIALTTLCGVALGSRWRWPVLAEILASAFAVLSLASLVLGALVPSVGRMSELFPGAWRGVWIEKNTFGEMMTFGFLIFAAAGLLNIRRAVLWWPFAVLDLALLLASTSKTSLVALLLGVAALGFVWLARRGGAVAVLASYAAVVGVVGLGAGVFLAPDVFFALLGKDATLTGRTKIWAAVIRLINERPWLGYGYQAVWTDTSGWGPLAWIVKDAGFKPEHAHNSWLEQWLGMGLFGLGAWALYYLTTLFRAIWAVFTQNGALLAFPFLIVFTLMSLTESVAVIYNDVRWVIFVALSIRLALPDREASA
jgi:exopolysaccharide production protein ExoQ